MRSGLVKKEKWLFAFLLTAIGVIVLYMGIGYVNSYVGYYGYEKDKYRRFSKSKEESLNRKVFIKNLNYSIDSVNIDNIFLERAYKWGSSSQETYPLTEKDTFKNNNPLDPYQIVISFEEDQRGNKIFIPESKILLKDGVLGDTLFKYVYIRDSLYKLKRKKILRIYNSKGSEPQ